MAAGPPESRHHAADVSGRVVTAGGAGYHRSCGRGPAAVASRPFPDAAVTEPMSLRSAGSGNPHGNPAGNVLTGAGIRSGESVTLIVVNHNGGTLLRQCLEGVARQTCLPARIVVVDNASRDDSVTVARRCVADDPVLADRVVWQELPQNVGFAAGNNRAITGCETEFVALLNPDAVPRPEWLAGLLAAADRHPEAAAFGSRQMQSGSPDVLDGIGDILHIGGLAWRARHGCRIEAADLEEREIFSPCAAAALYRRAAVVEVGGFDEDFFCYFEDVDLGYRLRLAGHRAVYVPDAVVEHVGGASAGGRSGAFAAYHGHRNLVWCFVKNTPLAVLPAALLAHSAQTMISGLIFVGRGQCGAWLAAKWHAVVGLAKMLRKRSTIQRRRRASAADIWRALDRRMLSSRHTRLP